MVRLLLAVTAVAAVVAAVVAQQHPCAALTCSGRGRCEEAVGCVCWAGYEGTNCERESVQAAPAPATAGAAALIAPAPIYLKPEYMRPKPFFFDSSSEQTKPDFYRDHDTIRAMPSYLGDASYSPNAGWVRSSSHPVKESPRLHSSMGDAGNDNLGSNWDAGNEDDCRNELEFYKQQPWRLSSPLAPTSYLSALCPAWLILEFFPQGLPSPVWHNEPNPAYDSIRDDGNHYPSHLLPSSHEYDHGHHHNYHNPASDFPLDGIDPYPSPYAFPIDRIIAARDNCPDCSSLVLPPGFSFGVSEADDD